MYGMRDAWRAYLEAESSIKEVTGSSLGRPLRDSDGYRLPSLEHGLEHGLECRSVRLIHLHLHSLLYLLYLLFSTPSSFPHRQQSTTCSRACCCTPEGYEPSRENTGQNLRVGWKNDYRRFKPKARSRSYKRVTVDFLVSALSESRQLSTVRNHFCWPHACLTVSPSFHSTENAGVGL